VGSAWHAASANSHSVILADDYREEQIRMTEFQNLHTHTTYCDGALTPEEMVKAAIDKGFGSIGFSEHSYVPFDIFSTMDLPATDEYVSVVNALKEKYDSEIEVFVGLEHDYYTETLPEGLDYTIGTLHYTNRFGQFISVDAGVKYQIQMVKDFFGGDYYALAEDYFSVFSEIAKKTKADIVGHFDLIAKYNIDGCLFDEQHPRYVSAALCAMDEILKNCKLFEVNTGAMYRVGKLVPFPSPFLLKELKKRGGEVILSSDSHDSDSLCFKFGEMKELLKACGFKHMKKLTKSGFVSAKL